MAFSEEVEYLGVPSCIGGTCTCTLQKQKFQRNFLRELRIDTLQCFCVGIRS